MDSSTADLWMNTVTARAQEYQGLTGINIGQYILSLLLVVGLLALLAWLLQRWSRLKKAGDIPLKEENILFYSRFNSTQTLILMEKDKTIQCMVLKGRRMEFMTEIPGLRADTQARSYGNTGKSFPGRMGFQEIWQSLVRGRKGGNR